MDNEWQKIGIIGVDSGTVWVGDGCYCITPDATEHPAKTWPEFCNKLDQVNEEGYQQFNFSRGHSGLGVVVSSGYGDGNYPVFIKKNEDGRVVGLMVEFD